MGIWGRGCVRQVLRVHSQPSATVRNRRQAFATVCVRAVTLSTMANASEVPQKVCQIASCRRNCVGVCRGGVCESDLWHRSYIGVCKGGVCVSDLCRRKYIGVCRGSICVIDPCRPSYIGICKGSVCRNKFGVCRGGGCVSGLCCRN